MEKKSIVVNGKNIAFLDAGNKTDPTVLMLHGFPESSLIWSNIMPTITECGYRAIAPDFPGFGHSECLDAPHTWENYMNFVSGFLEAMKIEQFHMMVHDWGGLIGLRWAYDHPERILSMIVSDTPFSHEYEWHGFAKVLRTPEHGERSLRQLADKVNWESTFKPLIPGITLETLDDFYRVMEKEGTRNAVLELYRSGNLEKLKPQQGQLQTFKRPVTIIWGEQDPYVSPSYAYKLREAEFPQANVRIIPNAGHFILIESHENVCQHVREHFLPVERNGGHSCE